MQTDLGMRRTRSSGREEEGRVRNNQDCALDREEKGLEEKKERQGTVTRVTAEQIHIVTDNGTRTWRAPQNLRKIPIENNEKE